MREISLGKIMTSPTKLMNADMRWIISELFAFTSLVMVLIGATKM